MSMVRSFFGEKNTSKLNKVSIYLDMFSGHPDMIQVDRYLTKLKNGGFKGKNAFLPKEELYKLTKKYFNEPFGSGKYETAVTDVYCFCGKLWRILNNKPYGFKEKMEAKGIQKSYNDGKEYLKAAVWVAVHSYMTDSFLSMDGIDSLIPIGRPDLCAAWNRHLSVIHDAENFDIDVYHNFYISSTGTCPFHEWYLGNTADPAEKEHPQDDTPIQESVVEPSNKMDEGKTINGDETIKNHEEAKVEPKASSEDKKQLTPEDVKENARRVQKEAKVSFKEMMDKIVEIAKSNDLPGWDDKKKEENIKSPTKKPDNIKHANIVQGKKENEDVPDSNLTEKGVDLESGEVVQVDVIKPEQTFTQEDVKAAEVNKDSKDRFQNLKTDKGYTFGKLRQAFTSHDGTEDAAGRAPDVPDDDPNKNGSVQNGTDEESTEEADNTEPVKDQYTDYNTQWEKAYPGLDKFTKIVHSTGYSVVYAAANNFPGLILTQIVDMSMNQGQGGVKKYLFIDPGFIYGDTMRIISTDRPDGNLYREVYLSRNNKKDIVKLIKEGLTKEDRKRINESLPRSIFNVIDHVDMQSNNISNFFSWKYLVINISNVLKNLPNCRMRLVDVEANNKFKLICDDKVINIYDNGIMDTDSHKDALENGLYVDYNPEKYGDKLYIVGYKSGKDLEFDPYRIMPKKKEEKKENKEEVTKEKKEDDANK